MQRTLTAEEKHLPLNPLVDHGIMRGRRKYVGEMIDHALSKGVKFKKPGLGVTP